MGPKNAPRIPLHFVLASYMWHITPLWTQHRAALIEKSYGSGLFKVAAS
jgi:hypothetical protein